MRKIIFLRENMRTFDCSTYIFDIYAFFKGKTIFFVTDVLFFKK